MFKSAATKIAHNSTLPSLALSGNKDLRPLQDLITLEKNVLTSLQKLSVDFTKASEALRTWGAGEGDDLGDILGASTTILAHFSAALSGYATREHAIRDVSGSVPVSISVSVSVSVSGLGLVMFRSLGRTLRATDWPLTVVADLPGTTRASGALRVKDFLLDTILLSEFCVELVATVHLKQIRTREEALDELKRRRKATLARADSAEKKLNKMGPEHKNLAQQTDILNQLQAQIRGMDGEIMNEEAALGDFKRTSARALMGLKFGGLMECCEKGCVVAEEISEEQTTPGMSRAMYLGHQRTEQRVAEAERCVAEIVFSALPPSAPNTNAQPRLNLTTTGLADGESGRIDFNNYDAGSMQMQNTGISSINMQNTGIGSVNMQNTGTSGVGSQYQYDAPPDMPPNTNSGFLPPPDVGGGLLDAPSMGGTSPGGSSFGSPGGTYSSASAPGGYTPYPAPYAPAAPGGPYAPPSSAPGGTQAEADQTQGGDGTLSSMGGGPEGPGGGRFATFPVRGRGYSLRDGESGAGSGFSQQGGTEAPPSLGATRRQDTSGSDFMAAVLDAGEFGARRGQSGGSQFSLAGGSTFTGLTKQQEREREFVEAQRRREEEQEPAPEYEPYEPNTTSHSQVFEYPGAMPPGPPPGAAAAVVGSVWAAGDNNNSTNNNTSPTRTSGPGSGIRAPNSNLAVEEGGGDRQSTLSDDIGLAYMNMGNDDHDDAPVEGEGEKERQARLSKHVRFGKETEFGEAPAEPQYMKRQESTSSLGTGRSRRVPPPTFDPIEDERALNAAAAREVSRELDALNFSPPPVPPPQVQVQNEGNWEFATPPQQQPPSPPRTSPQNQYAPPPRSPPQNQYSSPASPPPPNREPSPLIPPAAPFSRKATLDNVDRDRLPPGAGHQSTPSWDAPAPAPAPCAARAVRPWTSHHAVLGHLPRTARGPRRRQPRLPAYRLTPPPGARTISAAAFRRPQKTASGDIADTSPLALKKRLPASPYPQARTGSALRETSPQPPPQQQQQQQTPQDDDAFDYISAYTNGGRDSQAFHDDGSPMEANFDYGRLGKVEVVGGTPKSPGYSEGRFATDLDGGIR
ncbi:hypothetical protein MVEN_00251000 [Mycena venus]|uniref:Uncharacterized protein n=1 Tax=Mycena venus TaxID=2733690 RepID=A0A8H6YZ87_9AGAR|nr:hypothetical protein MVEN_00251000 [Mycena venus]